MARKGTTTDVKPVRNADLGGVVRRNPRVCIKKPVKRKARASAPAEAAFWVRLWLFDGEAPGPPAGEKTGRRPAPRKISRRASAARLKRRARNRTGETSLS